MYDLKALKAEVIQMEEHTKLFEDKVKEIRKQIIQHEIWIAEIEKNENSQKS